MEVVPVDDRSVMVGGETLDARQIDRLVQELAIARHRLQPEVPLDVRDAHSEVMQEHNPVIQVAVKDAKDTLIAVRSQALGWHAFTLSPRRAASLRDMIANQTVGILALDVQQESGGEAPPEPLASATGHTHYVAGHEIRGVALKLPDGEVPGYEMRFVLEAPVGVGPTRWSDWFFLREKDLENHLAQVYQYLSREGHLAKPGLSPVQ